MKQREFTFAIIGALLGGILIWVLVGNSAKTNQSGFMGMMSPSGDNQVSRQGMAGNIDAHFIEQMIPHHEDAITMAKLGLEKATNEEIKTLSKNIIDSQQKEIDRMRGWYKDWYGRELPVGDEVMRIHGMGSGGPMHMGMMGDDTDLDALRNASDFDKVFIEQMIPHHQMAVMMASMLLRGSERDEMKQLADDIIKVQTEEIDQMRTWYSNWYK